MALTTCPDCEAEISTEAYVCPRCGRPTGKLKTARLKGARNILMLWAALIAAFFVIWQILGKTGGHGSSSASDPAPALAPPSSATQPKR